MDNAPVTAAGRYSQLEAAREPFLSRAREASKYTIPSLIPPSGHSGFADLLTPYQGVGARGVNNLAAKLLLALLPPNSPFFRLTVDDFTLKELTGTEGMRAKVEDALASIERAVVGEIEATGMRVGFHEGIKHLIVGGNVLLYLPTEGGIRVFRLDRYVVKRDPMGNVLEILIKEQVTPDVLPADIRDRVKAGMQSNEKTVELFTHVIRRAERWDVYQEAKGEIIPGSKGTYPLDKSPWIPLRWTRIDGEDYGRGHVEEYLGDLKSLEGLAQAIVEGSAAAAKVLFLVNPNGTTDVETIAEAENAAIVDGVADDVSVLQVQKFADFRIAFETISTITERLGFAFLLNTSIQRSGERVTAEEIRYMAGELEDALGGVYSILSQEMQLPFINRLLHQMERQKRLPALPKGIVRPTVVTGLEALGRGHDLNKLDAFMQGMLQALGPQLVQQYLNVGDYITRRGTALGIDMKGLVKSQEEIEAAQQQAMQMEMLNRLGPNAINQLGGMAQKGMESGAKA